PPFPDQPARLLHIMDRMHDKIRAFLKGSGMDVQADDMALIKLLRFFEREYDAEILGFLEQEWLQEEMERDFNRGTLGPVRSRIPPGQREAFDADLDALFGDSEHR
ncbi:MAG: hypothetical protein AAGI71_19360, partial [Bacteroidota bacterium]